MDNTFYKPTLEDVVFTTDDYIIGKNLKILIEIWEWESIFNCYENINSYLLFYCIY